MAARIDIQTRNQRLCIDCLPIGVDGLLLTSFAFFQANSPWVQRKQFGTTIVVDRIIMSKPQRTLIWTKICGIISVIMMHDEVRTCMLKIHLHYHQHRLYQHWASLRHFSDSTEQSSHTLKAIKNTTNWLPDKSSRRIIATSGQPFQWNFITSQLSRWIETSWEMCTQSKNSGAFALLFPSHFQLINANFSVKWTFHIKFQRQLNGSRWQHKNHICFIILKTVNLNKK